MVLFLNVCISLMLVYFQVMMLAINIIGSNGLYCLPGFPQFPFLNGSLFCIKMLLQSSKAGTDRDLLLQTGAEPQPS